MATIYNVAKLAGVSPKTVSRVLNGDAPVRAKTRAKVEAAIEELGFVPSNAARMMRSNRSGLIGLITGAISRTAEPCEPHGLPELFIVQGIQKEMARTGKTLMIADTGGAPAKIPQLIRTFAQHRVEGLIYVAEYHQKVALDISKAACPMLLSNCFDSESTTCVLPDDRGGQRDLVREIIESGHRRIGFLTLDNAICATVERTMGYRDALQEAGIAYDPMLVTMGYPESNQRSSEFLIASLDRLLNQQEPPTVLCCGNDEMALRVYGLLRTRGIMVPEQMSVAGFDDYRTIAETLFPPLTTAVLPYLDMGRVSARTLIDMIEGRMSQANGPIQVSGPVVWRSSVTALNCVVQLTQGRISK